MKKIVLFNHKGGVSKTTTAFNLGWKLAQQEETRVLLVDADPQCNLSSLFLGDDYDEYYENEETQSQNIKDGVRNAFDGIPKPIEPLTCPYAKRNKRLYLLPGHMTLSEFDAQLNFAQTATQALSSLKSLPGAFNDLINKTSEKYCIDYVIIDLNPGLSAINQNLFLISDAFIIPTNPDAFSLMAIKSLSSILPRWIKWKNENIALFQDSAYPLPTEIPRFVGEIAQRFNIRNGAATKPYHDKIEDIVALIKSELIPSLQSNNMLFSEESYKSAGIDDTYKLCEIKDFQGLAPKSQKYHVPVFALSDDELEATGAVLAGMKDNRDYFGTVFQKMAEQLILLLK